jgi:hypothetical protein
VDPCQDAHGLLLHLESAERANALVAATAASLTTVEDDEERSKLVLTTMAAFRAQRDGDGYAAPTVAAVATVLPGRSGPKRNGTANPTDAAVGEVAAATDATEARPDVAKRARSDTDMTATPTPSASADDYDPTIAAAIAAASQATL